MQSCVYQRVYLCMTLKLSPSASAMSVLPTWGLRTVCTCTSQNTNCLQLKMFESVPCFDFSLNDLWISLYMNRNDACLAKPVGLRNAIHKLQTQSISIEKHHQRFKPTKGPRQHAPSILLVLEGLMRGSKGASASQ